MSDQPTRRTPLIYRDFNLRFGAFDPAGGTYRVWVEGATPGGGSMKPDDAPTLSTLLPRLNDLINDLDRRSPRWNEAAAYELGTLLAGLALPDGPVRRLFEDSLAAAIRQQTGLRLRLHIDALPLANIPWEFICLRQAPGEPQPSDFLALRREVSIARTDSVSVSPRPTPSRPRARLVVALSSPADQPELDVSRDEEAIQKAVEALNQTTGKEAFEIHRVARPATPAALQSALQDGADLFHFGGHGEFQPIDQKGQILLERDDGSSEFYDAGRLAQILRDAGVRLALLGACDTGRRNATNVWSGIAPALTREGIPAVIANQFRIRDVSAILIAAKVYHRLLAGFSVDEALYEARQAIFQSSNVVQRDWGTPVLYLRESDGVLFPLPKPEEAAAGGAASPFIDVALSLRAVEGKVVSVAIGEVSGGTIRVRDTIDEVKAGGEYTGVKIDKLG
jgi:hypothetical protein